MDAARSRAATRFVGNPPDAAAVEMTLARPGARGAVGLSSSASRGRRDGARAQRRDGVRVAAPLAGRRRAIASFGPARARRCARTSASRAGSRAPGRLALTQRLEPGEILMVPRARRATPERPFAPASASLSAKGGDEISLRVVLEPATRALLRAPRDRDVPRRNRSASPRRATAGASGWRDRPLARGRASEIPPEGTALGTIQVPG